MPGVVARSTRLLDASIMVLSAVFGAGSMALLATMESIRVFRSGWSDPAALLWDTALSLSFFLQHSGMVRRPFRERLARTVPPRFHGAFYSIASGVVLALVVVLWQRSEIHLFVAQGLLRTFLRVLSASAVALFVWSALALRGFDPLGLGPIRAHLRGVSPPPLAFVVRGPYRWVRHPLYSCLIVLIWSSPDVTADRLLFNVLWTAWIWVGTVLEERDLVAEFGEPYLEYRREVPMLVPWRGGRR